jgi:hypothetical protein
MSRPLLWMSLRHVSPRPASTFAKLTRESGGLNGKRFHRCNGRGRYLYVCASGLCRCDFRLISIQFQFMLKLSQDITGDRCDGCPRSNFGSCDRGVGNRKPCLGGAKGI